MSTEDLTGSYWYCEDHKTVERFAGCGGGHRIGPFDTEQAASQALQTIADRNREHDAEDARWED